MDIPFPDGLSMSWLFDDMKGSTDPLTLGFDVLLGACSHKGQSSVVTEQHIESRSNSTWVYAIKSTINDDHHVLIKYRL